MLTKLINRRSFFDEKHSVKLLSRYTDELLDGTLEDYEILELFVIFLSVHYKFSRFTWEDILQEVSCIDDTEMVRWLTNLSKRDKNKLIGSCYRSTNTLIKKDKVELTDDQIIIIERVLLILGEVDCDDE